MALLLLPAQIPRWLQYLIAFATGYIIDIFLGSYGVQTFACVLMLFMRPLVEKLVSSKRKRRYESSNSSTQAGKMPGKTFGKMAVYILLLVFIHHLSVVLLETFTFQRIDFHILIAVGNTLFTSSLIIGIEQLFRIRKQKE
jgi:cell shape-determining protein MreD